VGTRYSQWENYQPKYQLGTTPTKMKFTYTTKFTVYSFRGGHALASVFSRKTTIKTVLTSNTVTPPGQISSEDLINEFPTVFDDQVKPMEGESFHIKLTDEFKPFCVKTPRTIPFAYREKLKLELETLQNQGIITPVTHPTEWCAPIVVTPKKDSDSIRLCVDLSHLNRYVKRERYHSATPAQAVLQTLVLRKHKSLPRWTLGRDITNVHSTNRVKI
jgi:hypothetical protein